MKILILASNPRKDLRLDREIRDLKDVIEKSHNSQQLEVVDELAVRVGDLQGFLFKHQPQIVHFCGHGTGTAGIMLEDGQGGERLVRADALSEMFRLFSDVNAVLLNACYSEEQANAIVTHIDYVIGMRQTIRDDAAIAFSKGFYRALGYDCTIEQSFEFGCNAIQLEISGSSKVTRSTASLEQRKLEVVEAIETIAIPEHQKPILKKKSTLSAGKVEISTERRVAIQVEVDKALEEEDSSLREYREQVREYLADRQIEPYEQVMLDQLRDELGLSVEETDRILAEEQAPILQARRAYEQRLTALMQFYPFNPAIVAELKRFQERRNLTDVEVAEISQPIFVVAEAARQEALRQEQLRQQEIAEQQEADRLRREAAEREQEEARRQAEADRQRREAEQREQAEQQQAADRLRREAEERQQQIEAQQAESDRLRREAQERQRQIEAQAEADRLRREAEERQRQQAEANRQAQADRRRREAEQTPPTPTSSNWSRRRVIRTAGLAALGVAGTGIAVTGGRLLQPSSVTVNEKGEIVDRLPVKAKSFVEELGNGIRLEMVQIPGGKFLMGSPDNEEGRYPDESPQHQVTVPSFAIGKFEVTQAQWKAIASLTKVKVKIDLNPDPSYFKESVGEASRNENRPVEQVSWEDAVEFCDRLSRKTGKKYRLPSEAEWEYACRAGTTTAFHFGETIAADLANYNGNYTYGAGIKGENRSQTIAVGSFPPNAFGLYDMHGNVWEWCADYYHDSYQGAPANGAAWVEGGDRTQRMLRGGSWNNLPRNCRSADRSRGAPDDRYIIFGFRVCLPFREDLT